MKNFEYSDIKISGGPKIEKNSEILLLYKIALTKEDLNNGKFIESTYNPDIPIKVKVNIEVLLSGVYQGLLGMHGGGSIRHIFIPANMAYGIKGFGKIPPNSPLYIEVCVVSVIT